MDNKDYKHDNSGKDETLSKNSTENEEVKSQSIKQTNDKAGDSESSKDSSEALSKKNQNKNEEQPDSSSSKEDKEEKSKKEAQPQDKVKNEQDKKADTKEVKKAPPKKPPAKKVVEEPKERYLVSSSPHIYGKDNVSKIMWTVSICLAPAGLYGIYLFGIQALLAMISCIAGAVGAEYAWQKLTGKKVTIKDGSAFLTGLLLAYNLPPSVPLWLPFVGGFFAIIIVKQFFGGLGYNIFNPALAARGFLLASWPQQMTTWWKPGAWRLPIDARTAATPLALMKENKIAEFLEGLSDKGIFSTMFFGGRGGSIGEMCAFLLLLGGIYLIIKKYIDWQIPAAFIGTVAVLMPVFYGIGGQVNPMDLFSTVIFSIFSGGLILGAFYMATDYVTCPATVKGRIIFAIGCGVLTSVIRRWGGLPEGVCYSILIMNAFVPLIDDKVKTSVYGVSRVSKEKKAQ